ncbi:MAG: hypothetical protein SVX43_04590 [Cyanobacteriota bacterium]|nr:hypothetical protein [Cyanobacteriota bacterium]
MFFYGLSLTFVSLLLGVLVLLLPFALPQISLANYFLWLDRTKNHGLSPHLLWENLQTVLILVLPLGLTLFQLQIVKIKAFKKQISYNNKFLYALVIGIMGTSIVAAKPGSGTHHLLPYLPFVTYFCCLVLMEIQQAFLENKDTLSGFDRIKSHVLKFLFFVFLLLLSGNAIWKGVFLLSNIWQDSASSIVADIEQVIQSYPEETIAVGYGSSPSYFLSDYRPIPVFAGNPYSIDSVALMDMQKAGIELPDSTLEALRSCRIELWLIPQGESPFSLFNYYDPNLPLFNDTFKAIFQENYAKEAQSQYYDLWFCQQSQ